MHAVPLRMLGAALALAAARPLYDARLVQPPPRVTTAAEQRRKDPTATACAIVDRIGELVSERFSGRSAVDRTALALAAVKRERRYARNLTLVAAGGAIAA